MGIGILATFMVFAYRTYLRRILQEKERFYLQQVQHERNVLMQMVKAQEYERERLAGELHDAVGNKLNLLSLWVNHRTQFPSEEYDVLIRKELAEVVDTTRSISHQLFPAHLEVYGFIPSLDELVSKLGLNYHLNVRWPQEKVALGFEKEIQVYRIVQEMLSNTVKHAHADTIILHVRRSNRSLQLMIGDDGSGFEQHVGNSGIGLSNISSRLRAIRAQSKWKIRPGKGVRLIFSIAYEDQ